jgi:hypothetical protein
MTKRGLTSRLELSRGVERTHLGGGQGSAEPQEDREAIAGGESRLEIWSASHRVHRLQGLYKVTQELRIGFGDDAMLSGESASSREVQFATGSDFP